MKSAGELQGGDATRRKISGIRGGQYYRSGGKNHLVIKIEIMNVRVVYLHFRRISSSSKLHRIHSLLGYFNIAY